MAIAFYFNTRIQNDGFDVIKKRSRFYSVAIVLDIKILCLFVANSFVFSSLAKAGAMEAAIIIRL